MRGKFQYANQYSPDFLEKVKSVCLYLATKLGDIMNEVTIVGGLVPSLIIEQEESSYERHVGTMDLDIGFDIALLDSGKYVEISQRLKSAGFEPDKNETGNLTFQRWKIDEPEVTIDFMISPVSKADKGGTLINLDKNFAAVITPGLSLAFKDRLNLNIEGNTVNGAKAQRNIWVCGPGAYVVLKSLAFGMRGENKDAYDLYYVIRNYGKDVDDVAKPLRNLMADNNAKKAIEILKRNFTDIDGVGPVRVALFLEGKRNDEIQSQVVALIKNLLNILSL